MNFRVDPGVVQAILPSRFRPKLQGGHAIAGLCLIRLEEIRPLHVPRLLGISSENGAHRIAVTWEQDGSPGEGVYIPRRDTGSLANHLAGGHVFPGEHHHADFTVEDDGERIELKMRARDDGMSLHVRGRQAPRLPATSVFPSLQAASDFFARGSLGYSDTSDSSRLDGIKLVTSAWKVEPLEVEEVHSTFFSDPTRFPPGSVEFDCALVMRDIAHEWHSEADLRI